MQGHSAGGSAERGKPRSVRTARADGDEEVANPLIRSPDEDPSQAHCASRRLRPRRGWIGVAGSGLAAPGDPNPQQAARCARAAQGLDRLQAFADQLAGQIAQVQATLANGGLTARQTARAQARLAGLQSLQAALNDLIGRLSTVFAQQCHRHRRRHRRRISGPGRSVHAPRGRRCLPREGGRRNGVRPCAATEATSGGERRWGRPIGFREPGSPYRARSLQRCRVRMLRCKV